MTLPPSIPADAYATFIRSGRPARELEVFLAERALAGAVAAVPAEGTTTPPAAAGGGSYWQNAKIRRPIIDGIRFDSATEARRYQELRADQGIEHVDVHPVVTLPGGIRTSWDFLVFRVGQWEPWLEEIKGRPPGTDRMRIIRLHRATHPLPLRVLLWRGREWKEI